MTKKFFRQRRRQDRTLLQKLRHTIECLVSDTYYNVSALEECLKDTFGIHRRMFDASSTASGTKVAVIASNISDGAACIFSNYNSAKERSRNCGELFPTGLIELRLTTQAMYTFAQRASKTNLVYGKRRCN